MDKAEGKAEGSSNAGVAKERVRQGYDKASDKKKDLAKKIRIGDSKKQDTSGELKPYRFV